MVLPRQRRRDNRRRQYGPAKPVGGFRLRAWVACAFVVLGFGMIGVRLLSIGFIPYGEPETKGRLAELSPFERGDIVDANGELMATTLAVQSLFADPAKVLDVDKVARKLPTVLTELNSADIRDKLSRPNRRFVWLKRALTPQEVYQVNALGLPGLGFRTEDRRVYPQQNLAAHIVGATNYRGKGVSGVEGGFEQALEAGQNLELTIDMRLQRALHDALAKTMKNSHAKGAWGITLDAENANVLAMVSLPDYDANAYGKASPAQWMDKNVGGVYEMGSTFKIFTVAMAQEQLHMSLNEKFECAKPLHVGRFKIRDAHRMDPIMTMREVFAHSSNIGAAQIGDRLGPAVQQEYFGKLGLLDPLDVGLVANASPLYPDFSRWKRISTMSMSYGHGIAVTPMQMVAAARAATIDGVWKQPIIAKNQQRLPEQRVFSPQTIAGVRKMLGDVVEYGTGKRAAIHGYQVGGKTGTAEKSVNGEYLRDKHMASFFGVMPLDKPRFVTLIMVDEADDGIAGGGTVAAPAFAEFSKQAAAILGIIPTEKTVELLAPQAHTDRRQASLDPLIFQRAVIKEKAAKREVVRAYYHPTYQ